MPLFGAKPPPKPSVPSSVVVDMAEEAIVRLRFSGPLDGPLVARGTEQVRGLLKTRRARVFLIDGMEVTEVDSSMRGPGLDLLGAMKLAGVTAGFVATSSSVVRLVATTLGMASGFRIELLETTELALRRAQAALKSTKDG
jgi:hypothetical protein